MKNITIVLVIAALAVGLAATKPVASLNVKNRSDAPVAIYFYEVADGVVGLNPVLFVNLEAKTNKLFELAPGEYQIERHACGEDEIYTTKIAGHFNLTIPACPRWTHVPQQHDGGFKLLPVPE